MRFASLGSGSRGNALVVESGRTRLLIDCGFSVKTAVARLARLDIAPESLDAILVTHEHSDHLGGVAKFAGRFGVPVCLTYGTFLEVPEPDEAIAWRLIDSHAAFAVGDIEIRPFPVPHDAREPVQFVLADGQFHLGVLTDTGSPTPHIVDMLKDCDALVLECNHDAELLQRSAYPASVKRRIAGNRGHLENAQAAELLAKIGARRLQHVVAAHLSEQNNLPELAAQALSAAMGCSPEWIGVAGQEAGFDWRALT